MNKDLFAYFLILLAPLCVLPFATHRLLSAELARSRTVGNAFLQAKAENYAAHATQRDGVWTLPATDDKLLVALIDAQGKPLSAWPVDGRCFGEAPLTANSAAPRVRVAWAGNPAPGFLHRRQLHRAEFLVWTFSALFFILGIALIFRALIRSRREARRQYEMLADFTHRLKTPLTSISLCAELSRAGRLPDAQRLESVDTIVGEAAKLDALVDEVLDSVKEFRRG